MATDGGLLEHPVQVRKYRHGVAERYEWVIDFAGHEGRTIRVLHRAEDDQNSQIDFCKPSNQHVLRREPSREA